MTEEMVNMLKQQLQRKEFEERYGKTQEFYKKFEGKFDYDLGKDFDF